MMRVLFIPGRRYGRRMAEAAKTELTPGLLQTHARVAAEFLSYAAGRGATGDQLKLADRLHAVALRRMHTAVRNLREAKK